MRWKKGYFRRKMHQRSGEQSRLNYISLNILLIFFANYTQVNCGTCPQNIPYAYHNGAYCCHYSKEKSAYSIRGSQDANCDGSDISITSECCEKDAFVPCPTGTCTTPLFTTSEPCPEAFPNTYFYGLYCCKNNVEKANFEQRTSGTACQNNALSYKSLCCLNNEFTPCPNPPCVGSPYWALTWHAEGNDDSTDEARFSRKVRYGSDGIILGKGYKLLPRLPPDIQSELEAAGLATSTATKFADIYDKVGSDAQLFLMINSLDLFVLTHAQQWSLFTSMRDKHITTAQGLYANFDSKDPSIRGIVIDLLWTGDLTGQTRAFLDSSINANSTVGLTSDISNQTRWPTVSTDRYNRRKTYMENA